MLIIRPPKISWPISFCGGAMIFIILNFLYFSEMEPSGGVREVSGNFEVIKVGRRDFPAVVGGFGVAKCVLTACANGDWKVMKGMPAVAFIDQDDRIFDLKINGEAQIEREKIKRGQIKIGLMILAAFCFFVANVGWLISILREKK